MSMPAEALQGQQPVTPAPGTEGGQPGQGPTSAPGGPTPEQQGGYSQLASEFLKGIPEGQRVLLEPFLKQWDAGVTKQFQELQSKVQPYEQLGADPETLAQAYELMQLMDEHPEVVYKLLHEDMGFGQQNQGLPGQATPPQQQPPVGVGQQVPGQQQPPAQGFEPHFEERFGRIEQVVGKLAEMLIQSQQAVGQQDEDAQLDAYLGDLKTQLGDFDEDWVVMQIGRGMDGEQAVKAWQSRIQDAVNANGGGAGNSIPPTLSGGSVPPPERIPVGKLPGKDIRNLVAGLVEETNKASQ